MNKAQIHIAAFAAVSIALGIGCATPEGSKPAQQWNQAAVTTLAGELVSRVENAHTTANKETVQLDQMESVSSYLDNLRILERQCRHLQAELQAGKGYPETLPTYDEIKQFYRVVQNSPSWQMIEDDLGGTEASVAAVLRQLDGYYGKR
jgi:hypothetical protein